MGHLGGSYHISRFDGERYFVRKGEDPDRIDQTVQFMKRERGGFAATRMMSRIPDASCLPMPGPKKLMAPERMRGRDDHLDTIIAVILAKVRATAPTRPETGAAPVKLWLEAPPTTLAITFPPTPPESPIKQSAAMTVPTSSTTALEMPAPTIPWASPSKALRSDAASWRRDTDLPSSPPCSPTKPVATTSLRSDAANWRSSGSGSPAKGQSGGFGSIAARHERMAGRAMAGSCRM